MNTNYIYTDKQLCHMFRPNKCKSYPVFFKYHIDAANQLVINNGLWTAGMNLALDLICNVRSTTMSIKDIQCKLIRNDALKYNVKLLSRFEFIGRVYDGYVASPIIDYVDGVITLRYVSGDCCRIPTLVYGLNTNAQFIYRRFIASHKWNYCYTHKYDTVIDYLGLNQRPGRNLKIVYDNLNELQSNNLIKFTSDHTLGVFNITKSL